MIVVDSSAVLAVLVDRPAPRDLVRRVLGDGDLHAPYTVDVEVLHALRGLVRGGKLTADQAQDARADARDLLITRHAIEPLADRAWSLRENLTAYDAVFVALAESLDVPLVTKDRKLAAAPGVRADIELY